MLFQCVNQFAGGGYMHAAFKNVHFRRHHFLQTLEWDGTFCLRILPNTQSKHKAT